MKLAIALASVAALAACAESPEASLADLAEKAAVATAATIPDTSPAAVAVSDVTRTPTTVTWRAKVSGGDYACSADELMRLPDCRRIEG